MATTFDDDDRFVINRWDSAKECWLAFLRLGEKLQRLNNMAFRELQIWSLECGLSVASEKNAFAAYRENWCDPSTGRHAVELVVDHAIDTTVFDPCNPFGAGVWCGDLRLLGCRGGKEKDLRKQFGKQLRSLIAERHPRLFSNGETIDAEDPFVIKVQPDMPLHEIVLAESKFSNVVVAEFKRMHPLVELIDQVISCLHSGSHS